MIDVVHHKIVRHVKHGWHTDLTGLAAPTSAEKALAVDEMRFMSLAAFALMLLVRELRRRQVLTVRYHTYFPFEVYDDWVALLFEGEVLNGVAPF